MAIFFCKGYESGMDTDIETILWVYIKENFMPRNSNHKYGFDENLLNTGIIDSAGLIAFIVFIEQEFNIQIPDEDLLPENFSSVNKTAAYIRSEM